MSSKLIIGLATAALIGAGSLGLSASALASGYDQAPAPTATVLQDRDQLRDGTCDGTCDGTPDQDRDRDRISAPRQQAPTAAPAKAQVRQQAGDRDGTCDGTPVGSAKRSGR